MILVGPGTGVAPMMGFLQERRAQKASGIKIGKIILFFGCRSPDSYIYEEELNAYVADGTLANIHVAFSRIGNKEYVQTLMKIQSQVLWELLQVCLNASIPFDLAVPSRPHQVCLNQSFFACSAVHISMSVVTPSEWPPTCETHSSSSLAANRKWITLRH